MIFRSDGTLTKFLIIMGQTSHSVICHPSGILCSEALLKVVISVINNEKEFFFDFIILIHCRRQSILRPEGFYVWKHCNRQICSLLAKRKNSIRI
jgi:hypothetical protein